MNSFQYTGRDNLDVMSFAQKYNASIYNWLSKDINEKDIVLDYGSGQGEFYNRFHDFNKNIYAVELDTGMHHFFPNGKVFSSVDELERKFNLIYSVNVLEHIKDDLSALIDLKEYLAVENSTIKIFVPARQELYSKMDEKVGHYRRYSKKQLKSVFDSAGFEIIFCRYFDFLGYFATGLYKILGKDGNINLRLLIFYDKYIFPISRFLDKLFLGFIGKNIMLEARVKET